MERRLSFFIGASDNLKTLNLSFLGYKIIGGSDQRELIQYLHKINMGSNLLQELKSDINYIQGATLEDIHGIVPINFRDVKDPNKKELKLLVQILRVIFDFDFSLALEPILIKNGTHYDLNVCIIGSRQYNFFEKNSIRVSNWDNSKFKGVSIFLKKKWAFLNKKQSEYIRFSIENYIVSLNTEYASFKFLSLCSALEGFINQAPEISFRLKRTISILVGKSPNEAQIIYLLLDDVYKLRSKITHGNRVDTGKIESYLPQLREITRRAIFEVIVFEIPSNEKLGEKINSLGFGDWKKIGNNKCSSKFYTEKSEILKSLFNGKSL
ncbi:MAG: hypothetical protein KDC83_11790 [Flavobacteriales bacterium]|nr:hypothetical protein [Flavobacteriales bacterium]